MPRENRATITLDKGLKRQLNKRRKDRGQTWTAYLQDAGLALERDPETVPAASLDPATVEDLALQFAQRTADELESRAGAPW